LLSFFFSILEENEKEKKNFLGNFFLRKKLRELTKLIYYL